MEGLNEQQYGKWKKQFEFFFRKLGREGDAEDCLNSFCLSVLEGKSRHQTTDQFAIDYLREDSGRKGSRGYDQRRMLLDAGPLVAESGIDQLGADSGRDVDARIDLDRICELAGEGRGGFILRLYVKEGLTLREIGQMLSITESRVCQIFQSSLERLGQNMSEKLTKSERDVYRLLVTGLSNQEIANKLFVEENTVKFHLTNIYQKLGCSSRAQAIADVQKDYLAVMEEEKPEKEIESMSNWEPMQPRPANLPNAAYQPQPVQRINPQEHVTFIVDTFKINETMEQLHTMQKEVTKGDYSVEKVMAACQCIGRANETIQTVMKAAQVLVSGR